MKSLSGALASTGAPKAMASDCVESRSAGSAIGNHWMPVPIDGPVVRKMRPTVELMTMEVGSIGLTAKLTPPTNGHCPAPVAGLSPDWTRPVVRLIWLLPVTVGEAYRKKSEASGV